VTDGDRQPLTFHWFLPTSGEQRVPQIQAV
jgi:hypothetical protein